jgi:predicted ATPase
MITKVTINHFKSLRDIDLPLSNISVLVGANGAGKSNFIDALKFVKEALKVGLDRAVSSRHGIDSIRQWAPTRPYQINMRIDVKNDIGFGHFSFTLSSSKGDYSIRKEEGHWTSDQEEPIFDEDDELVSFRTKRVVSRYERIDERTISANYYPKGKPRRFPDIEDDFFLGSRLARRFVGLQRAITDFEAYSIFPNTLRSPQEPRNDETLDPHGGNLTSLFKKMRKTRRGREAVTEIVSAMENIMPRLNQISVQNIGGFLVPRFHVEEETGHSHIFNQSQISDGTLRVLGILTALYQVPRPSIIALEEPELTVNPGIFAVLADAIREASQTSQILVTTHSPEFLDYFDPSEVRAVEMSGGESMIRELNKVQKEAVRQQLFSLGELHISEGLYG